MATLDFLKRMLGAPATGDKAEESPAAPGEPGFVDRRQAERKEAERGLRVLVVDDSQTILNVLTRMLEQNEYEVIQAMDGESALETARAHNPELIFLDVVLPGLSGFETLRQMRKEPALAHTPVIMISGNAMATEQFYVKRIGADEFMKKPFGRVEVFSTIQRMVEEGRLPKRGAPHQHLLHDDGERVMPDAHDATPPAGGAA